MTYKALLKVPLSDSDIIYSSPHSTYPSPTGTSYLGAFAPAVPTAQHSLPPDICMGHSLTSIKSVQKSASQEGLPWPLHITCTTIMTLPWHSESSNPLRYFSQHLWLTILLIYDFIVVIPHSTMYAPWGSDFAVCSLMYPKLPEQCLILAQLLLNEWINEWITMADQILYKKDKTAIYSMVVP